MTTELTFVGDWGAHASESTALQDFADFVFAEAKRRGHHVDAVIFEGETLIAAAMTERMRMLIGQYARTAP